MKLHHGNVISDITICFHYWVQSFNLFVLEKTVFEIIDNWGAIFIAWSILLADAAWYKVSEYICAQIELTKPFSSMWNAKFECSQYVFIGKL